MLEFGNKVNLNCGDLVQVAIYSITGICEAVVQR